MFEDSTRVWAKRPGLKTKYMINEFLRELPWVPYSSDSVVIDQTEDQDEADYQKQYWEQANGHTWILEIGHDFRLLGEGVEF